MKIIPLLQQVNSINLENIIPKKSALYLLAAFCILFAAVFILISPGMYISVFPNDINSNYYAFYGRNLLRLSPGEHRLRNIDAVVQTKPQPMYIGQPMTYYHDHPFLLSFLTGVFELVPENIFPGGRLVSILSSLGIIILCFFIAHKLNGNYLSALFSSFTVSIIYIFMAHGVIVNFEPLTLFFMLLSYYFFIKGLNKALIAAVFIGCFTDWPFYFFSFFLFLQIIFTCKKNYKIILVMAAAPLLAITVTDCCTGGFVWQMFHGLFLSSKSSSVKFDYRFFCGQKNFMIVNYGRYLLIAAALSSLLLFCNLRKFKDIIAAGGVFLFTALGNILFFREWAHSHPFWNYYFTGFFSIVLSFIPVLKNKIMVYIILILIGGQAYIQIKLFRDLRYYRSLSEAEAFRIRPILKEIKSMAQKNDGCIYTDHYIYDSNRFIKNYLDLPARITDKKNEQSPYIIYQLSRPDGSFVPLGDNLWYRK